MLENLSFSLTSLKKEKKTIIKHFRLLSTPLVFKLINNKLIIHARVRFQTHAFSPLHTENDAFTEVIAFTSVLDRFSMDVKVGEKESERCGGKLCPFKGKGISLNGE